MATDNFEIVSEQDLEFSKRGRKSTVSPALVGAISKLKKGQGLKLTGMTVNPNSPKAKTEKAKVSAQIRQAGKQAGKKVAIRWSANGTPQVILAE
jgi:hypothetical protein